jgi:transposase InsO family protein
LVRERIVIASIPNILSYARDLGLHKRKVKKKKQKRGSIEAEDEVWHMDITQINSKEGIVHYLHLLIDNYSRKILSWQHGYQNQSEKLPSCNKAGNPANG